MPGRWLVESFEDNEIRFLKKLNRLRSRDKLKLVLPVKRKGCGFRRDHS